MNTQSNDMQQILQQISAASTQLLQCLIKEHDALSLNQLKKLNTLSEQKQQLVTQLDQLDKQRQAASNQGDFIEHLKHLDSKLVSYWQSVTKLIKKCQQQNEVNGRLLSRRNSLAKETLEIFTGRKLGNNNTYGADGQQNGHASIVTNVEA